MKLMEINRDGETIKVWAHKSNKGLWIHCDGETFYQEAKTSLTRRGKSSDLGGGTDVVSPMPGKIMKINISVGDKVKAGETLIVMEAMKMEYSLKAALDGVIKKINGKPEGTVDVGQVLVEIEKAGE